MGAATVRWILFAQVTPDQITKGAIEGGVIWLLSGAIVVLAAVCVILYNKAAAKDARINDKDAEIARLIKDYGTQMAQLERAHGEKVEKMLSDWRSITENILRSLDRLSDTMERPIVKG